MIKKSIKCMSCETRCDIIITQSNFEDEEIEVKYCPVCSCDIDDGMDTLFDEAMDWS